ncbi:MAG: DNA polymerase III subunit alpha [Bacteroidetes bacterium MedPE-SWsnd-G2]|nr:MAG: DNA polymerase III subunit alpha [Bacteroidetes bacterium MedPE-SWsnd-G2]
MYLNCHSYYSLRFGTFSEVELLKMAQQNGVQTLALTDINNTSACLNFIRKATEFNIKPIIGIDFRNGAQQQFVGLAKTNTGFMALNTYLSRFSHSKTPIPDCPEQLTDTYIIYPFEQVLRLEKENFEANEFIGISIEDYKKLRFSHYSQFTDKLVIQQAVTIRSKRDFNAHRLLRAIDNNTLLSKLDSSETCRDTERMLPLKTLLEVFEDAPHLIKNTKNILNQCQVHFDFGTSRSSQNQSVYSNSKSEDYKLLELLCQQGLPKRYPNPTVKVKTRLATELKTIKAMDFVSYFLINHDIISYSKRQGYIHVGRGSGANSIVAYIIGITDVDPVELDLYFERFINPYRASPPDFDIDFSWRDREDITQYIFKRFKHTALLATYNTFKYRAVVRELGKVFGLPKEEIDKLSSGRYNPQQLDSMALLVLKYGDLIKGFPNHLSVHSAGILILDRPIHYYSATNLPPKGFPTVQFDMIIAEDVGVFKFDILGQRGLAKIKDAIAIIAKNRPELPPIDITQVEQFKTDPKINHLLKSGGAIGAYYVESPAMRGLMQKLQTQDYLGLVAASSIIRPGVSSSGMKNEYIRRHRHPERRREGHPVLQEIMPETYGIMVYQEDVLKVAHLFAGLTLGEADVLRRGMSGKFRSRSEFAAVEAKFISNCREKGYNDNTIFDIWNQIKSFAGYAFAKGHSASYAVESYQSLYLKCYFPLEFMVAVLNNGGGFYSAQHYIHEIKMQGGIIEAPCINQSDHPHSIQGQTIYLGFGCLKNLEHLTIKRLLSERQLHGPFKSLDDFIDRVTISIEQLTILIRINAFRSLNIGKTELLWQAIFKLNAQGKKTIQPKLFAPEHKTYKLPKLEITAIEEAYDQMELIGFPLSNYFNLIDHKIQSQALAKDMPKHKGKPILLYGILVNTRHHKTSKGDIMRFSTFTDLEGAYFDAVHFPNVVEQYPIYGIGVYACYGKVTEEFDFCSLDVIWSKKMPLKLQFE